MRIVSKSSSLFCSLRVVFLAFLWTVSLIYGVYIGVNNLPVVSLMRLVPFFQVSIVGLIFVIFLPLFISIVCAHYSLTIVIYIISLIKGFFTGYGLYLISAAFGDAAWLVRFFVCFSDATMNMVLLWFWYRQLSGSSFRFRTDCAVALFMAFLIGIIDYFLVSPMGNTLMNRI